MNKYGFIGYKLHTDQTDTQEEGAVNPDKRKELRLWVLITIYLDTDRRWKSNQDMNQIRRLLDL